MGKIFIELHKTSLSVCKVLYIFYRMLSFWGGFFLNPLGCSKKLFLSTLLMVSVSSQELA